MSKKMNETQAANTNTIIDVESDISVAALERKLTASPLERQGMRFAETAGHYPEALAKYSWSPDDTATLRGRVAEVARLRSTQAEAMAASTLATKNLSFALEAGLAGRNRLTAAFRLLGGRKEVVVPPSLLKVKATSRRPALLLQWFGRARSFAKKWQKQLAVRLAADPVPVIDDLRRTLAAAAREAIASRAAAMERTVEARKGRANLIAALDTLFLTAQIAFQEDPATLGRFRKNNRSKHKAAPALQPSVSKAA